ncbi:E3 ubiquitin-protein ligase RFWD3 [Galdieria sulphuraria]|nr:E3 ubiquitin-protein ligase RFWD3 [Galdieria sulphuraria]
MNDEGTSDSYEGKNKEQDVFSHGQQGNLSQSEIFCSICMEKFTESGNHYICCLSCGHIFGYSCITKWLKTRLICPTCNQKAKKRDVRRIYLPHTSIVMQDTTALEELKQQWQKEIDNKELLSNELCITKNQLKRLETSFAYLTQRYYELTREYQTLSQSVRNSDFVTKKSVGKFPLQYEYLFRLQGRFYARIFAAILSYSLENVGWCCDWSANGLYMACGMKNGNVVIYDIRKTDGYLDSTKLSGMDGVYYVDMATNRNGIYYQENILQLDEKQQDKPIFATCLEEMPSEGNRSMKSLIVSYRSSRSPTSHVIYSSNVVRPGSSACLFSYPQRFTQLVGGKNHLLLSRTLGVCWKDRHYFFTADESFRGSSLLWEWKSDNHSLQVIPETFPTCHSSPIYDVRWNRGLIDDVPDQALMGTLSKEELHIYKW